MLKKFNTNEQTKLLIKTIKQKQYKINTNTYILANLIFKDMMYLVKI